MGRVLSYAARLGVLVAVLGASLALPARAASGREPVIVIPGVAGSEFVARSAFRLSVADGRGGTFSREYGAGEKVWVNVWEAAKPGPDDYFDVLKLQPDATTPVAPALEVAGVYGDVYDDLIGYLERQGYVPGEDLWVFPYDWRRDIGSTTLELDALVTRALTLANGGRTDPSTWTVNRVDLVGHSMGGMVARRYIADGHRAARVDHLITLGSPQLGSVKFLKTLLYGDTFGPYFLGIGLDPEEIRDVVQNMPGALQLLPTRSYDHVYDAGAPDRPRPYVEDRDVDGDGRALGALDYDARAALLSNLRANHAALAMADAYHRAFDDAGATHGVRWSALVGTGHATVGQLREYTGTCWTTVAPQPCPRRDELPVQGDGTVPSFSAAMGAPWRETRIASGAELWYLDREHGELVADDEVLGVRTGDGPALAWIGQMLSRPSRATSAAFGSEIFLPHVTGASATPRSAPVAGPTRTPPAGLTGVWIAALGPVALEVADEQGRTTGRRAGEPPPRDLGIPGSRYERAPNAEFVFVGPDGAHTLQLGAEGDAGVDVKIRVLLDGRVERTAVYLGVALGPRGRAALALGPGVGMEKATASWPALEIDADGDGVFEEQLRPVAVLDARESADTTAPEVSVGPVAKAGGGAVALAWTAADDEAGLLHSHAILAPGTPAARVVRPGEPLQLPPGQHRVVVLAQDRAGNTRARELAVSAPATPAALEEGGAATSSP